VSGTLVDLSATGGGVSQAAGVGITADNLGSTGGVTGNVALNGKNSVAVLDDFLGTASGPGQGNFELANSSALAWPWR